MNWSRVDLHWAYTDLFVSIGRQTRCIHCAYDVLHDALLRFTMARQRGRIDQPHAYLRTVVRSVLADGHWEAARPAF